MQVIDLGSESITDHAFSPDRSLLCVARGNRVELYYHTGKQYELGATLAGHEKPVTAVDINSHNQIVSCSQDRNALVWEAQHDGSWKQTLVLLRINRAATCVRWSPNGLKFAVGSGARVIAVCYYEPENDWWIAKHIKKPLKSTVLAVAWHPNSVLLAAGTTDGHARVFSGFVKGLDEKPAPSPWGERLPFNTLCGDFTDPSGAWVNDVAFSPSGDALAWVTHDASILVAYPSAPEQPPRAVVAIESSFLPFRGLIWSSESQIIAAGFDCHPVVFTGSDRGWTYAYSIDDPAKAKQADVQEQSALNMFRQLDLKGTHNAQTALPTVHQNSIKTIRAFDGSSQVSSVSTSGDGKVVIFPVAR